MSWMAQWSSVWCKLPELNWSSSTPHRDLSAKMKRSDPFSFSEDLNTRLLKSGLLCTRMVRRVNNRTLPLSVYPFVHFSQEILDTDKKTKQNIVTLHSLWITRFQIHLRGLENRALRIPCPKVYKSDIKVCMLIFSGFMLPFGNVKEHLQILYV